MTKSKRPAAARKVDWRKARGLRRDFPLFPHDGGQWAKKVKGKTRYFGPIEGDEKGVAAETLWEAQKTDLLAGRKPRKKTDGLTVASLCNRFLTSKDKQVDAGELSARMREDYQTATDRIIAEFGKERLVDDLGADDFDALRLVLAKRSGPVHLGNTIQRIRTVFKYAYDSGLIDRPVRYGQSFKKPSKRTMRLAKAERGERMFSAEECRRLLAAADVHLRAMIYLGLNCGFGNADCGTLPLDAVDLDAGWITYHRRKTGIPRRVPLWPQTVRALRRSLAKRPKAKASEGQFFVTKYGGSWAKDAADNPLAKQFRKLLADLKLHRPGQGFYALRHSHRTAADGCGDQVACNAIMGHVDDSMAGVYRERIDDARLRKVTDHVRQWLVAGRKAVQLG